MGRTHTKLSVPALPHGTRSLPRRMQGSGRMWPRVRVESARVGYEGQLGRHAARPPAPRLVGVIAGGTAQPTLHVHVVSGGGPWLAKHAGASGSRKARGTSGGGVIGRYPAAAARLVASWCREMNRRHNVVARRLRRRWARQRCMQVPPFDSAAHAEIVDYRDYHRYATIAMALSRVEAEGIPGALAEAGVYRGWASRFIHRIAPKRRYYLFDTFEGFHADDLDAGVGEDLRFRDTSVELVLCHIGDTTNIEPRPGRVPETFAGLEGERFAFVLLDMDLQRPTLSALAFFYPRLSPGAISWCTTTTTRSRTGAASGPSTSSWRTSPKG